MNHILYSSEELASIMNADSVIQKEGILIRTILTDSRKLSDSKYALFFAIKARRDGHSFIPSVYDVGTRSFVISDDTFDTSSYPDANFYLVKDTLRALQNLSAAHRSKFNFPVIGITGSNGKTIVKEWLYQLLIPERNIIRSPKSYFEENNLAIFEAGISKLGEMENLRQVIRPTIGILTNIGDAHSAGFGSINEKIKEKLKLFEGVDLFIYSDKYLDQYDGEIPGKNKFTWNYHQKGNLEVFDDEVIEDKFQFLRAHFNGLEVQAKIPFTDQASVENAIICWACLLALGYEPEEAEKRLEKLIPVGMRLELKNGINNCSIIDDSYSLDLSSLAIALDFLKQQNQHQRRTLILSDIPGPDSALVYDHVRNLLESKSVDRLIAVGKRISKYAVDYKLETRYFANTTELLEHFGSLKFDNETILLKGARSFEFERISLLLTQKVHETVLEINLNALEHNLNHYKMELGAGTKIMAMVKAFSYGSGSFEIANLLEFNKVDYLAVAYADEGVSLRNSGCNLPIMVMSPDSIAFETIVKHKLEPQIYSIRVLNQLIEVLNRENLENYPVHIKLDTGMHRLGFEESELDKLLDVVINTKVIRIQSVFSHLAASEAPEHDEFTRSQIDLFLKLAERIGSNLNYPFMKHISNTSGINRWPDSRFDMVRLGIGLYGIDSAYDSNSPLQTVTSLKTSISQIKNIPAGDTIGYGREGKLPKGGKIATVKIGYADGYRRALGNGKGKMIIRGKIVPTIGKICMDMCMLDITGIDAVEGDEVIVFNNQIRVEDIAKQLGTIPYEILTGISQRVKRVYYYE